MRRWILVSFLAMLAAAPLFGVPATAPSTAPGKPAAVITLSGPINDYTRDALKRQFAGAKAAGAEAVILRIDTWGGMVTSALDISRFLKSQDDLHTIAYVDDKAISAGALIAMACDEIVMSRGATIGDCAPIVPGRNMGEEERRKAVSPIVSDFEDSARDKYDPLLARAFVIGSTVVHYVQSPDGARRFVTGVDYEKLKEQGWTPVAGVRDPIDDPDTLLTLGTREAVAVGLAKGSAESAEALAIERGLMIVRQYVPSMGDRLIELLSSDVARFVLLMIFLQSFYIAIHTPGHGPAEAIALISLGALVGLPLLTGYAQWWELLVIFGGLALLAFEVFVFPGHFVSGIAGIIMIIGGLLLTFMGKEPGGTHIWPNLAGTWKALGDGVIVVSAGLLCSMLLWIWLNRYLPKLPYFNRLILNTPSGDVSAGARDTGPALGDSGVAVTDLKPGGSAKFITETYPEGRIASVVSDSGYVPAGTSVVITEIGGNRIVVRVVKEGATA